MLAALLAMGGYSIGQIAIFIVVAVVLIGIVIIATRVAGVTIPSWVWQIAWLVGLAVVAIVAIRFVMSL
jgi:hypothetical protein